MKKIVCAAAMLLLTVGALSAQNNFRGIVRYKIESTGKVAITIKPEQSTAEIKVYDNQILSGQTVQTGNLTAETQQIDVSNLPQGMYFISVDDMTQKFVVR